jgi:hypothetical protein
MLMSLLVAIATLSQPAAPEPLLTCVSASIKRNGSISAGKVEASSGDKMADRRAMRHLGLMNVSRLYPEGVDQHNGFVLVRMHGEDMFTIVLKDDRRLFASCTEATEAASD